MIKDKEFKQVLVNLSIKMLQIQLRQCYKYSIIQLISLQLHTTCVCARIKKSLLQQAQVLIDIFNRMCITFFC